MKASLKEGDIVRGEMQKCDTKYFAHELAVSQENLWNTNLYTHKPWLIGVLLYGTQNKYSFRLNLSSVQHKLLMTEIEDKQILIAMQWLMVMLMNVTAVSSGGGGIYIYCTPYIGMAQVINSIEKKQKELMYSCLFCNRVTKMLGCVIANE